MPPFADGPDHQALPAAHIAASKNVRLAGDITVGIGGNIAAAIQLHSGAIQQTPAFGAGKAHRQQDQVGRQREFAALYFLDLTVAPFDADAFEAGHGFAVADHPLGQDRPVAVRPFLVAGCGPHFHRPIGPGHCLVFMFGRLGHDFQLGHAFCALPVGGADAVRAGIAAADHDHVLARRGQRSAGCSAHFIVAGIALVLLAEEFHSQPYTVELGAGNIEQTGLFRAASQHHRVEIFPQGLQADFDTDFGTGFKLDTFCFHLDRAPVDQVLLHFEIGDAITQQSTNSVAFLEDGNSMSGAGQLLGAGKACRAGTYNRHCTSSLLFGYLRGDPPFLEPAINNGTFDRFDGHRIVVDIKRASRFTWRGTNAAGEFGEIVGGMQHGQRVLPVIFVNQVVPVGDDVVYRTAFMAIRNAAIHAARSLIAQFPFGERKREFTIVLQTFFRREVIPFTPFDFEEAGFFAHYLTLIPPLPTPLHSARFPKR